MRALLTGDGRPLRRPRRRGRGVAGASAGGVRAGGMEERATLADRMYARRSRSRDPALRMWGHLWRIDVAFERGDLAAVEQELEPLAHCAAELRTPVALGTCCRRGPSSRRPGRFADSRLLADRAVAALPPSAAGRESAQVNRSALLSLIGLHTGEASDLTGLLDYGPGHEDGDGLDFPVEGVIFSIAAAFFLAHGGQLAQAATVYRRLGPPARLAADSHATTSCFASRDRHRAERVRRRGGAARATRSFRGRHVADGAGAVAYNGPVELYLGSAEAHLGLSTTPWPTWRRRPACANRAAGSGPVPVRAGRRPVAAGSSGDPARARTLGVGVVEQASALGMAPWATHGRHLVERLDDERGNPLTPREREVAVLVGEGLTNRQIAARLYLSERTAQNHVQHILTKLDLPNRGQIAVWVATRGE